MTREGREIIAEALRAVAAVLENHNRREQDRKSGPGGARRSEEGMGQDLRGNDPVTSPAVEMVTGALGVAQAATDVVTDAATGMMLSGIGTSETEGLGDEDRDGGRAAGKRQSSGRRTSSEKE
ncbi:hypothetical protein [Microvirga roseola]|uniref:hypothetical protein n=1 Tax=Microvirga roseola TaxID=2883126 RepID=UPI001E43693F|nr:hypothetical protein [Microvirga roseola]